MSTGMPELGSKISLISKADIRYEGRLFTVDPQECTIALSSVRSFGTEDRETQCPIPAQNQVYDYILFRGSDIKDIRVLNNVPQQTLNDPAIMQLSVPPSLGHQQFGGHPVVGHVPVPALGQYGGAFGSMGMASMPSGLAPGMGIPNRGIPAKPNAFLDMIGGASRSTTPVSMHSHKSSGVDQSVQAGGAANKKDDKRINQKQGQGQQRVPDTRRRGSRSRERKDSRGALGGGGDGMEQTQHRNQNRAPGVPRNPNYYQNNYGYQQRDHQGQGGAQNMRGGWNRSRGGPRPRGGPGGFRSMNQNQGPLNQNQQGGRKKNTLKFDNDYDFEQANTEFEELRSQFNKIKIDESSSTGTVKSEPVTTTPTVVNTESEKKDDSGNETGAGETEQEEDQEVFYDKKKSFFDKISCEAVERAKGKSQRTDWRQERKLNSETFGVSSTRRGNFRGRGGFRGIGYRGGFRPGYRTQQQRRDQTGQGKVTYPILNYKAPHRSSLNDASTDFTKSGLVDPDENETKTQDVESQLEVLDLTNLIEVCPGQGSGQAESESAVVSEVDANK